jgi:hypothetical protein
MNNSSQVNHISNSQITTLDREKKILSMHTSKEIARIAAITTMKWIPGELATKDEQYPVYWLNSARIVYFSADRWSPLQNIDHARVLQVPIFKKEPVIFMKHLLSSMRNKEITINEILFASFNHEEMYQMTLAQPANITIACILTAEDSRNKEM